MRLGSLDGEKKTAPKWRKHGDSKRLRREGRVGRGGRQTSSTTLANGVREVPLVAPGSWEQREKRPKRKEKAGQKRYCSVVEGNIYEKGWVLRVPTMGRNCTGRLLWFIGLLQILRKKSSTRVVYGFLNRFAIFVVIQDGVGVRNKKNRLFYILSYEIIFIFLKL